LTKKPAKKYERKMEKYLHFTKLSCILSSAVTLIA